MARHEMFCESRLHVLSEKCSSCIFRPIGDGRLMGLAPGRVAGMVREAKANGSVIPRHNTIYDNEVKPAVCRGYFDLPDMPALVQVAERMGLVVFDTPLPNHGDQP